MGAAFCGFFRSRVFDQEHRFDARRVDRSRLAYLYGSNVAFVERNKSHIHMHSVFRAPLRRTDRLRHWKRPLRVSDYLCYCKNCPRKLVLPSHWQMAEPNESNSTCSVEDKIYRLLYAYATYDESKRFIDSKVSYLAYDLIVNQKLQEDEAFRALVKSLES